MSNDELIGQKLGKYEIKKRLGSGGMAEVYQAYQANLDRFVAIKLIHPFLLRESDFLKRFKREARAMAALDHPNIIDVYDFDVMDNRSYIIMQYLGGGTLKDRLDKSAAEGRLMPMADVVKVVLEVADALAFAHSRGMIHRDIKPANIMFDDRGSAILTDFGIAKLAGGPTYTATGAMVGTPAYMSPEQGLGQSGDGRSDIYALGVLFYNMVTGYLPHTADTPVAVLMKHVSEAPSYPTEINTNLPREIEQVVMKALAKKPEERYQTPTEMARELRQAVRNLGGQMSFQQALPSSLLRDQPTPPPGTTLSAGTEAGQPQNVYEATAVMGSAGEQTQVADEKFGATVVAGRQTPAGDGGTAPVRQRMPIWMWAVGAVLVVALGWGGVQLYRSGIAEPLRPPTPTSVVAVAGGEATVEPTEDVSLQLTLDALAAAVGTQSAGTDAPTATPTYTPTSTPSSTPTTAAPTETPSPTVDPTVAFLAACETDVELVNVYSYGTESNTAAPAGSGLRLTWVLRNSGTCPWPEGLTFGYEGGDDVAADDPITIAENPAPGAEINVTIDSLFAPTRPGSYETNWAMRTAEGDLFGAEIPVTISVYQPATPTPDTPPTATPAPTAAAGGGGGGEDFGPVDFNFFVSNCGYPGGGTEWRCEMVITPFGGPDGANYTVWIFDSTPPARYLESGNVLHFITARRCAPWIHEVKVQNEASGESISESVYYDPKSQPIFPGGTGCEEPE